MQITLTNGYFIEVDERNYTLKQKYLGKTKEGEDRETERICGYYGKLDHAIEEFLKTNQLDRGDDQVMDMEEYAQFVSQVNKAAVETIKVALSTVH